MESGGEKLCCQASGVIMVAIRRRGSASVGAIHESPEIWNIMMEYADASLCCRDRRPRLSLQKRYERHQIKLLLNLVLVPAGGQIIALGIPDTAQNRCRFG